MSCSVKVKMDSYVRQDGTSLIYIQVIIKRKTCKVQVDLTWPPEKFNDVDYCQKRFKGDPDCNDYNIIIRDTIGRINEIFKYYRLANISLTKDLFEREYYNPMSKTDFIAYYSAMVEQRNKEKEIVRRTYLNHKNTLNKLKAFKSQILFSDLDTDFPNKFNKFLESSGLTDINSKWSHHKNIKTYLKTAKKSKIFFADPYEDFHNKSVDGKWKNIPRDEIAILYNYYKTLTPGTDKRRVLQAFIGGAIFIGLRISDWYLIKPNQIISDQLVFIPWKQRKKGKLLILPLTKFAIEIINDSISENKSDTIFYPFSEKHARETLKDIQKELELQTKLHPHAGRETFGTMYIKMGGDVTSLQRYFDHFKIQTTMKYVHINQEMIKEDVEKMNDLIAI